MFQHSTRQSFEKKVIVYSNNYIKVEAEMEEFSGSKITKSKKEIDEIKRSLSPKHVLSSLFSK